MNTTYAPRRSNRTLLSCALASCLLVAAPQVLAQSTSGAIRGQVLVDSAPAGEATVTATNVNTGLVRTAQAANGNYSLNGLPPGDYKIDVTANGQTSSRTVTLAIGQTATLNLGVGGEPETAAEGEATNIASVSVTGTRLSETKTSEVATYVSQRQIEALPQASRNFLAFADTVPGMKFETGADGSTKLRSGAQNSNGINVFIDGVGQKNYVLKGGVSGQDSSNGNPFPQLAIGEYKVITSNYKAEYDQISSAAVTALTKSGTNEFGGEFFWDRTDDNWRAATPAEKFRGNKVPSSEEQYGASFGGPIVEDKLFFFVTYEAKRIDRPRTVRPGDNLFDPADLTPELASYLGSFVAPFEQDAYFGKLTWQANDNNLVELSAKVRDEVEVTGFGEGPNAVSYASNKTNDSTRIDLRWQFSNENWLNDLHLTSEDDYWNPTPVNIGPAYLIRNNLVNMDDGTDILNIGGGPSFQNKGQKGLGFQNDTTFFGIENHTIKAGVKFKSVDVTSFEQQPYSPQYFVDYYENLAGGRDTLATFIPFRVNFNVPTPGVGDRSIESKNKQYGIYVQDDWQVNERLVLNLGLRYDYEETPAFQDYVTPAGLVTALRGWTNLQNADYDIEDYISNGSNRKADDDNWAPRLGMSYDLTGDQRHVIFGGAGRSYDRNLFDYLALEQTKSTFPGYTRFFNTPEHACTPGVASCLAWDPAYLDPANLAALVAANPNLGAEVNLINNDLETPYSDQFSIGMRNTYEVWGNDWDTSVTLAHVRSYDGILFTLGNRNPDGSFHGCAGDPGATYGCAPFNQPIPGYGNLIIADNGIDTKLNQLLLSVNKNFTNASPWGFTFAYTYSDAKENRPFAADSDEHYLFDFPNLDGLGFVSSIGIPRHRIVTTGLGEYKGLNFSGKLTLETPEPLDRTTCYAGPNNCVYDPYFREGSIGFKQVDVAVQKTWDTGSDVQLRIRGDVFNVFNWKNYIGYNVATGERNSRDTVWPPRMFKLSFGITW